VTGEFSWWCTFRVKTVIANGFDVDVKRTVCRGGCQ
jgi:hypothetical protein